MMNMIMTEYKNQFKTWQCDPIERSFNIDAGKSTITEPFTVIPPNTPANLSKIVAKAQTSNYPLTDTTLRVSTIQRK